LLNRVDTNIKRSASDPLYNPVAAITKEGVRETSCYVTQETFYENFELENFPFDLQRLKIMISVIPKDGRPYFIIPREGYVNQMKELPNWNVLKPEFSSIPDRPNPLMIYSLTLQRKWQWYVSNHMLVLGMLSSTVFYAQTIPVSDLNDRGAITFTLLLTVTAFKYTISDSLPKISYMTFMDYYILSNFMMNFVIIAENVIVGRLWDEEDT